jgi:hypothetical protein
MNRVLPDENKPSMMRPAEALAKKYTDRQLINMIFSFNFNEYHSDTEKLALDSGVDRHLLSSRMYTIESLCYSFVGRYYLGCDHFDYRKDEFFAALLTIKKYYNVDWEQYLNNGIKPPIKNKNKVCKYDKKRTGK